MIHLPWLVGVTEVGGAAILVAVEDFVTAVVVGALGTAGTVGVYL